MNLFGRRLVCGCGPKDPGECSLGLFLFDRGEFTRLHRHWRDMVECTFFGKGPHRLIVNGYSAPKRSARP